MLPVVSALYWFPDPSYAYWLEAKKVCADALSSVTVIVAKHS